MEEKAGDPQTDPELTFRPDHLTGADHYSDPESSSKTEKEPESRNALSCRYWIEMAPVVPVRDVTAYGAGRLDCASRWTRAARRRWSGFRSRAAVSPIVRPEQAVALPPASRRLVGPRNRNLSLPLGDETQHRAEPLVVDHRCRIDPLLPVEHPVRELQSLVADREAAIGVVQDRDALAGEGLVISLGSRMTSTGNGVTQIAI